MPSFGTQFGETMSVSRWSADDWATPSLQDVGDISLHPASHVLHYGSACFEGLKAHGGVDGKVRVFRLDRHVERMRRSAESLCLPVPPTGLLTEMVQATVRANLHMVPDPPGSLYLRPTLVGTEANIGAAASPTAEAVLFILTSPVGDYFSGGMRPLRLVLDEENPRTTPQFGKVKSGANYAMALGTTTEAKEKFDADQVLFAPYGAVQETGASNFLLLGERGVLTPELDGSFLEGVTRDSILSLAREMGHQVEERRVGIEEMLAWIEDGEAALSGTAAVLAPVGTIVVDGEGRQVGDGGVGRMTVELRQALVDLQVGRSEDRFGWTRVIEG